MARSLNFEPAKAPRRHGIRRSGRSRLSVGAMGFTLVEMTVALVIVGLVLTVGVPATMKYMRSSQIIGARNTLMSDLNYARSLAGMRRKTYEVSFTSTTYKIYQVTPNTTIMTRTMPSGTTCTATDTATFFAWGLSVPISVKVKAGSDSTSVLVAANGSISHG